MNAKERMYDRIEKHGNDLKKIFNLQEIDAVVLCKQIHTVEIKAGKLALDYCNGDIDMDQIDSEEDKIMARLDKIINFKSQGIPVFFNRDPRGYSLKIDNNYIRNNQTDIYRDMGGYGILSPEFDGKK